ncbi:BON domain-containing protein [Cupriavidus pinatubonensis]|uniref:BON domain-containing protein n=1 Tax=Cupriavidus pinatubonensis TaxID=248026 RepID=UPI0011270C8A|nr:BON domain-containing protein [Cupriavidus pinatubonensis]QYY28361.1 BON domain-containing protein [Cupriavidus pinatubonensis]TPQ43853.1 RNA-binding protein [Cupriavidus pinatubonensis]
MSYYDEERYRRERSKRRDDDDWQPESGREAWQSERARRRLTPGQTSYGGPAPQRGGYGDPYQGSSGQRYGERRYDDPDQGYGSYGAERYQDNPSRERGRERYGDRYGGERYGGRDEGRYRTEEAYRGGGSTGGEGRHRGSELRYGMNGGYGWDRASEWRDPRAWQRDDAEAERQWRQSVERARERERQTAGRDTYFNDLRSDTRYWTEADDDRAQGQRYERRYSREAAQRRGWEVDEDRDEDHGALYNLGRRIGEAVGDLFGTSERHERHVGPRGYQRTDERIRDQICERLSYARGVDISDVSVDVKDSVVTLSGTVKSRSQKYYIEDLADSTYGVSEVNNDIRVRRDTDTSSLSGTGETTGSTWRG